MRSDALALLGLTVVLLAACELDKTTIPRTEPRLGLHGVLSASASTQVVLLERTRSGRVQLVAPPFDLGDPVVSDEGIAEAGATMILDSPDSIRFYAREDATTRSDGKGQGIYRFALPGRLLVRDATYRLTVRTAAGETLTAETSVPDGVVDSTATFGTFDRSRDTLALAWPVSPTARSYFVRIETPFGPRSFFTQETQLRLPGFLRNTDLSELPHVFLPGFVQAVTVSAVDSNYYDWYRTHSDPFSGEGLINRVEGGLGVFGALVRLRFDSIVVTAPQTRPYEGRFQFSGTAAEALGTRYLTFDIYLESPAARSDQSDALSGSYRPRPRIDYFGCPVCGMLGSVRDGRIELALLKDWSAADTVEVFDGRLVGDTIIGNFRLGGGPFRFVRQH